MCRCEDERMICVDVKMRSEHEKKICVDVKMRG